MSIFFPLCIASPLNDDGRGRGPIYAVAVEHIKETSPTRQGEIHITLMFVWLRLRFTVLLWTIVSIG